MMKMVLLGHKLGHKLGQKLVFGWLEFIPHINVFCRELAVFVRELTR